MEERFAGPSAFPDLEPWPVADDFRFPLRPAPGRRSRTHQGLPDFRRRRSGSTINAVFKCHASLFININHGYFRGEFVFAVDRQAPARGCKLSRYASTPPMGWNSWDCFGTTVTEMQTKQQADFMAEKLKAHGWQ